MSTVRSVIEKYNCDAARPLYGGNVTFLDLGEEWDNVQAMQFSNRLAIMPLHCLGCLGYNTKFSIPEADIVIVETAEAESLYPIKVIEPDQWVLHVSNRNTVRSISESNVPGLFLVNFEHSLQPGDSGCMIIGTGQGENLFTHVISEVQSPLFMVIARDRDTCRGLALYLPHFLFVIRMKDVLGDGNQLFDIDWRTWEPISKVASVRNRVRNLTEEWTVTKLASTKAALLNTPNAFDKNILTNLFANDNMTELQNAFLAKVDCGATDDKCWIVELERDNLRSSTGYFKQVDNFVLACGKFNGAADEGFGTVFNTTSCPITLDLASYQYFKKKGTNNNTACHHPFLCELNQDCKGKQKEKRR